MTGHNSPTAARHRFGPPRRRRRGRLRRRVAPAVRPRCACRIAKSIASTRGSPLMSPGKVVASAGRAAVFQTRPPSGGKSPIRLVAAGSTITSDGPTPVGRKVPADTIVVVDEVVDRRSGAVFQPHVLAAIVQAARVLAGDDHIGVAVAMVERREVLDDHQTLARIKRGDAARSKNRTRSPSTNFRPEQIERPAPMFKSSMNSNSSASVKPAASFGRRRIGRVVHQLRDPQMRERVRRGDGGRDRDGVGRDQIALKVNASKYKRVGPLDDGNRHPPTILSIHVTSSGDGLPARRISRTLIQPLPSIVAVGVVTDKSAPPLVVIANVTGARSWLST